LRKLGSRKEDVTGGWGKLNAEECLDFCFLPDTTRLSIEEEKMGGARGTMEKNKTHAIVVLVRNPEGKRLLGKMLA